MTPHDRKRQGVKTGGLGENGDELRDNIAKRDTIVKKIRYHRE